MSNQLTPIEVYKNYLAFKNHFTKEKYDYFKYRGRSSSSTAAFNKRKDRYFFERMSRKKTEKEIRNFFLANFIESFDSNSVWIGQIIDSGEKKYLKWKERNNNLFESFKSNADLMFDQYDLEEFFSCKKGHSPILKEYFAENISIEEMVIYDKIFHTLKIMINNYLILCGKPSVLKLRNIFPF